MLKVMHFANGKLLQRGQFISYPLEKKLEFIEHYQIGAIVNLWHAKDEELIPYVWKYYHHYFQDSEIELDTEFVLKLAHQIAIWIRYDNKNVLVHCYGGNNRSGLITALTLRQLYNIDGKQALEIVRRQKKRALHNRLYESFLYSLPRIDA